MAAGIVRLADPRKKYKGEVWYCDWSTSCDGPRSQALTYAEMVAYMVHDDATRCFQQMIAGDCGIDEYEDCTIRLARLKEDIVRRLNRLNARGTSWMDHLDSGEQSVKSNRAGPEEKRLSLSALIDLIKQHRDADLANEEVRQTKRLEPMSERQQQMLAFIDEIARRKAELVDEILLLVPQPVGG